MSNGDLLINEWDICYALLTFEVFINFTVYEVLIFETL
jgi:hypothetical protein